MKKWIINFTLFLTLSTLSTCL